MSRLPPSSSSEPPSDPSPNPETTSSEPQLDPRNFWAWVAYQLFYRIGWQFKMEATLMAGIVSYLSPSPAVMGLFTTMNSLGRNFSPLIAAPLVDRFRHKRSALFLFWGLTVLAWTVLTLYLWTPTASNRSVSIWVFGACYTMFFVFLGSASVAQGALLGKIIPAGERGKAMAVGMTLSGAINVGAILLIYTMIRGGSFPEPRNYALAFSFTVLFFLMAAASLLFIREPESETPRRGFNPLTNIRHFVNLGRENSNLARLIWVNVIVAVMGSMLQFYTGYWRTSGTMSPEAVIMATVFQVFWQSLSSSILGRVADRRGNRHIICALLWVEGSIPIVAWILGGWEPFRGHWGWYLGVYTLVGLRFPLYQLLVNYLLEIVPQRDHAMAIGAVTTAQLLTAPVPILFGAIAEGIGYPATFVLGSLFGVYGGYLGLGLREVRVVSSG